MEDAWFSADFPCVYTRSCHTKWQPTPRLTEIRAIVWEGHYANINTPYCQIEKLQNLEALPDTGFMVACFPTKIRGSTAGWTRAVALVG